MLSALLMGKLLLFLLEVAQTSHPIHDPIHALVAG